MKIELPKDTFKIPENLSALKEEDLGDLLSFEQARMQRINIDNAPLKGQKRPNLYKGIPIS